MCDPQYKIYANTCTIRNLMHLKVIKYQTLGIVFDQVNFVLKLNSLSHVFAMYWDFRS